MQLTPVFLDLQQQTNFRIYMLLKKKQSVIMLYQYNNIQFNK